MITVTLRSVRPSGADGARVFLVATVRGNEVVAPGAAEVLRVLHSFSWGSPEATLEERLLAVLPCWNGYIRLDVVDAPPAVEHQVAESVAIACPRPATHHPRDVWRP